MRSRRALRVVLDVPKLLFRIVVYLLTLGWIREVVELMRENLRVARRGSYLREVRRGRPLKCRPQCAVIRSDVYRRPDPMIYSQKYLLEQGLAVTWDNPDIQLFKGGAPVLSSSLEADTDYEVVATIWNNSIDAPAASLPVEFSFRSFGVGASLTAIGTKVVNLPVKGAPGHPTMAQITWRTPAEAGHYCLRVRLDWDDDANPKNNLGQENTNVAETSSPSMFRFPVRNADTIRKTVRLIPDAYTIPERVDCRKQPRGVGRQPADMRRLAAAVARTGTFVPPTEEAADWERARARHAADGFPIPAGWQVIIAPSELDLAPDETRMVNVSIEPPDDFRGARSFNVRVLHGTSLVGGVTLTVTAPSV